MAKVEDCPGFETFGADVKAARKAKRLARKTLAEMVGIEWRYLANIENQGAIPSLPVMIQLIKVCGLPVERYMYRIGGRLRRYDVSCTGVAVGIPPLPCWISNLWP